MKTILLFFVGIFVCANPAFGSFNYLGKVADRGIVITYAADKAYYLSGEGAKFTGTIKVTGKSSLETWWDDLIGKKLKDDFKREGIDIVATFPNSTADVSNKIKIVSSTSNEIKFTFTSDSISAGDLNQFSVRVYNNDDGKEILKKLAAMQAKLERRLAALEELKRHFVKNRALSALISMIEHEILNLQKIFDRIAGRINFDDNLLAENTYALQVENQVSKGDVTSTLMNGFKWYFRSSIGATFPSETMILNTGVIKAGAVDGSEDYYKLGSSYQYLLEVYRDGVLMISGQLDRATGKVDIRSDLVLSKGKTNTFTIQLHQVKNGKKLSRLGIFEYTPRLLPDTVSPRWIAESLPARGSNYVQQMPEIVLVVEDSFGRLNPAGFSARLTGTLLDGNSFTADLSSKLSTQSYYDGAKLKFSGVIPELGEGRYTFSAGISDSGSNLAQPNPYTSQVVIDRSEPIIFFADQDNSLSSYSHINLNFSVTDISPVSSQVFVNGLYVGAVEGNIGLLPITLAGGLNVVKIVSTDLAGNRAEATSHIIFDITPPILSFVSPTEGETKFTNVIPFSIPVSILSNEAISDAKVGDISLVLSSDTKLASGNIDIKSDGVQTLSVFGKDIAGNLGTASVTLNVVVDDVAPAISLDSSDVQLTNQLSTPIRVLVQDNSNVWSKVIWNGRVVFETRSKDFVSNFELDHEGSNEFYIVSTDEAGNHTESLKLNIVRDTIAPSIEQLSPADGSSLDRMIFAINGVSNENLKSAKVDGASLAVNGKTFSGQYISSKNGPQEIEFYLEDFAGNISSKKIQILIDDVLLVPSLISVVPDANDIHMWIVGAAGATRPLAEVGGRSGFFGNSIDTVAAQDGSFRMKLENFISATVSVTDVRTGESASTVVSYSGTTSLAGTVKDVFGSPLPGATIGFDGSQVKVVTDSAGTFFFSDPPTGDQTLVVDGTSVPLSTSGDNKKYFKTKIALNIGRGQSNQLGGAIFMTPLLLDGSETSISASAAATVTSIHAPDVTLLIPAGASTFPDGKKIGVINMVTVPSANATTEVPLGMVPTKVVSLEPSGTQFSKPVQISVANDNDLPPQTPMVFFSMNSAKGVWEIDGYGKVTGDGKAVTTNPDSGITHFSLVYAAPLAPVIATVKNPNLIGISTTDGGVETSFRAPSYQILGQETAPTFIYKSGWANPTAVVSNIFTIPTLQDYSEGTAQGEYMSPYELQKSRCVKYYKNFGLFGSSSTECIYYWEWYWRKLAYTINWQSTNLWVPDSITSQFFVGSVASDQVSFNSGIDDGIDQIVGAKISNAAATAILKQLGLPQSSIVSYAVELKDPKTGEYMSSGIHPSLARYQIKLRNMTITTGTTKIDEDFGFSSRTHQMDSAVTISSDTSEYLPSDLSEPILVQNKSESSYGRGWQAIGFKRIYNPTNTTIMLEEGDGGVSTYALNSIMSTVFDGKTNGVNISRGVDLSSWPKMLAARVVNDQNYLSEVDFGSQNVSNVNALSFSSGYLSSQGYYQCAVTNKCDAGGCYNDYSGQFSSVKYKFNVLPMLSGVIRNNSNEIFIADSLQHALYGNNGSTKILGEVQSIDDAVAYTYFNGREVTEYFNGNEARAKTTCESLFGVQCAFGEAQATRFNCANANIVRTCTWSNGMNQVLTCNYTQHPNYMYTPSVGTRGIAGDGLSGLNSPGQIVGASDGSIVVVDSGNNRVVSIMPTTGQIRQIAGDGRNIDVGDDGPAISAGLFHPRGAVYDNLGNLYISSEAGYIRKVTPEGKISKFAGLPIGRGGVLADSADMKSIAFNNPHQMVFNSDYSVLFIADTGNHRIMAIDIQKGIANKIAGTGLCATEAIDGDPAIFGSLCSPKNIGLDNNDNLLIADGVNNKVRRVTFSSYSAGAIAYAPSNRDKSRLFKNADGSWTLQYRDLSYDSFNANGFQVANTDRKGLITRFAYDSENRLTEIEYPNSQKTTYTYRGAYLESVRDPAGRTTSMEYSSGNLMKVTLPDGARRSYTYSESGYLTSEKDEMGAITQFDYNAWGRLTKVTTPDGAIRKYNDIASQTIANSFTSGDVGQSVGIGFGQSQANISNQDANLVTTELLTDHMGFVSTIKDGLGNISKIIRDRYGRPIRTEDPSNIVTEYVYDQNTGDLLSKKDIGTGLIEKFTYNQYGDVLTSVNKKGLTSVYEYNSNGTLKKMTTQSGEVQLYEYDNSYGLISKHTLAKGGSEISKILMYNTLGQINRSISSDGKEQEYSRDLAGNVLGVKIIASNEPDIVGEIQYDLNNKVLGTKTADGKWTRNEYNANGMLVKTVGADGTVIHQEFDLLSRLVKRTRGASSTLYSYDGNGNQVSETNEDGVQTFFDYDILNRIYKIRKPDETVLFEYDAAGRLASASNNVSKVTYESDTLGRVVSATLQGVGSLAGYPQVTLGMSYDGEGMRTSLQSPWGVFSYDYSDANKLTSVQNPFGEVFSFGHDDLGRLVRVTRPGAGNYSTYSYDNGSLLSSAESFIAGSKVESFHLKRDSRNLIAEKQFRDGTHKYSYDANAQLLSVVDQNNAVLESFTFDDGGNISASGSTSSFEPHTHSLKQDVNNIYEYDKAGNLLVKVPKDSSKPKQILSYNSSEKLIRVEMRDQVSNDLLSETKFIYDVLGRRVKKETRDLSAPSDIAVSYSRFYVYDGDNILAETSDSGEVLAVYTRPPNTVDQHLSVRVTAAGVTAKMAKAPGSYYLLSDELGSLTLVYNQSGSILQKYKYSAYGVQSVYDQNGQEVVVPDFVSTFTFTGREFDRETGLYYLRARYYDPLIGRFIGQDKYVGSLFNPMSVVNKYAYASNSPTNYIDSFGFDSTPVGTITMGPGSGANYNGGATSGSGGDGFDYRSQPLGYSTGPAVVRVVGGDAKAPVKDTQAQFANAMDWIQTNHPWLVYGVKPKISFTSLPLGTFDALIGPGGNILISTYRDNYTDAEAVGLLAHELCHLQDGFYKTVFPTRKNSHDLIRDIETEIKREYNGDRFLVNWDQFKRRQNLSNEAK